MQLLAVFLLIFIPLARAWWKHMILYEILVTSFKDSNGDGYGDLNGINEKVDHFCDLGIDAIYLTPIFQSPMIDLGYDITNYTAIDPLFGTMEDFKRLVTALRKRGIKLIGDLVINHSSDEHPWFKKSIDRVHPYTDYYVWVDPKTYDEHGNPIPPNNWMSIFEGSAWKWNDKRKQFYLHNFTPKQPDLNLRNDQVKREIKKIIQFWFENGMSGFRLDAPAQYMEDPLLRDEPLIDPNTKQILFREDLNHIYTSSIPETYVFVREIRQIIDDYNTKHADEDERILIAEAHALEKALAYYDQKDSKNTHFPFNFLLPNLNEVVPSKMFDKTIQSWLKNIPAGATPNWVAENHDFSRVGDKLGVEYQDIITITIMTLPGIACIYYGQEIGLRGPIIRSDQKRCLVVPTRRGNFSRDGSRTPMQWDNSLNAGFSSNSKTWLPVHPNYWTVNVETEKAMKQSRYTLFKTLSILRKTKTLKYGSFNSYILSKWVYSYVRSWKRYKYVIILNLGTETEMFDLHEAIPKLPTVLKVVAASQNAGYYAGNTIIAAPKFPHIFVIRPSSAIVLTNGNAKNYKSDNE